MLISLKTPIFLPICTGSGEFEKDEIVMIEANAAETGKQFKEWIGLDSVEFVEGTSKTSVTAKFKMPAEAVAATATYEDVISGEKYTVTAYGLYGDTMIITPGTTYKADYAKDERVALQIGKRSGYTLKDLTLVGISVSDLTWTAKNEEINDRGISFTMPDHSVTITVNWTKINSGSSGGGGGGGGSSKPTEKPTEKPEEKPAVSPTVEDKNDTVKIAETTAEANAAAANAAKADDKVTLVTEGTNVSGKDFANPAVLKIPADTKDVKNVNQLTLARLNAETGKLEIVGGSYDAKANAVVGYVVEEGSYFVVEKESLTTISMQIGNNGVVLNNENKILDAAPLISQNRTMVPLRFIAEAFGANVSWAQDTKTVTIVIDGKVLTMRINQELEDFGAAPIISNGRTMVPIRYISEELGANVIWVPSTKTVAIAR